MTDDVAKWLGTIGWLVLIVLSTIRRIKAGHLPFALLNGVILAILTIDFMAILPLELRRVGEFRFARNLLLWGATLLPYLLLVRMIGRADRGL